MKLRRLLSALCAAAAALCSAAPAPAANITAQAKATVLKPIALQSVQDLDLGTLVLSPGTWSSATVSLSRNGALTCPANVTCSGATQPAIYNVAGSNKQTVIIYAPSVVLVNQSDPSKTLTMTVDSPGSVTLTNSGAPGTNFPLGGSITIDSSTATGTYLGTFEVSAEYQ